jgi:hypothetical protein
MVMHQSLSETKVKLVPEKPAHIFFVSTDIFEPDFRLIQNQVVLEPRAYSYANMAIFDPEFLPTCH